MAVSHYSVVTALVWAALGILLGRAALRKAPGTAALVFLLAGVRLLAPLKVAGSVILRSKMIYPALRDLVEWSGIGRILLLLWAAGCVLWWYPVMPGLCRDVEQLLELRCDRRVCRGLDEAGRLCYLDTLLRLLRREGRAGGGASMEYQGGRDLVQRFQTLLDRPEKAGKIRRLALWGMCAALFAASYGAVLQPWTAAPAPEGEEREFETFDLAPGTYAVIREAERYKLCRESGAFYCPLSRLAALTSPFDCPEAAVPADTPLGWALDRTAERERALCAVSPAEETIWRVRKYHGAMQKRLWSHTRGQWRTEWITCCSSTGVVSRVVF